EGNLDSSQLPSFLSKKLPSYMIPAHFLILDQIPLTPDGKINNSALPEPGFKSQEQYMAPGTPLENKLVEIWQAVLGVEKIGVNDNFFMLGGDSIKSIQIASRMNQAGYKIEINHLFKNPTISGLAPLTRYTETTADQSVITGMIPLTPIQEWFFQEQEIDPHHYNQAVILSAKKGFDEEVVEIIFIKILEHHDALRSTYEKENGRIIQTVHGLD
ncbi:MAG: non-ribosomal peptide synthetase, partial [bacterium]|nr:non-ribosomal peptide synthetase [bacterium]